MSQGGLLYMLRRWVFIDFVVKSYSNDKLLKNFCAIFGLRF